MYPLNQQGAQQGPLAPRPFRQDGLLGIDRQRIILRSRIEAKHFLALKGM
jgi:hypothetical protein